MLDFLLLAGLFCLVHYRGTLRERQRWMREVQKSHSTDEHALCYYAIKLQEEEDEK